MFERHLRIISIFIIMSLLSSTAFATSIVAVRNNDEIVIGADSKTTLISAFSVEDPKGISKCKIVQTGNIFFASAGSVGIGPAGVPGNIEPALDMREIVAKGLEGEGRIADKVDGLEKILVASLSQIAEKARQENAVFFMERFAKYPIHSVIVVGLDNEELVLLVRTFTLIISPSGSLSFDIGRFACPGDCPESFIIIFAGQTGAIRQYLQKNMYFRSHTDFTTAVRDLVELEISKEPSFVGAPVDILRLTKQGAEWIQRKSLCPDIRDNSILQQRESNN